MNNHEPTDLDYFNFRDNLADDIRRGHVEATPKALFDRARDCAGVDYVTAAEWAERFLDNLNHHLAAKAPADLATSAPAAAQKTAPDDPSTDPNFIAFRECLAADIRNGRVELDPEAFFAHAQTCAGVDRATAIKWVEKFCEDVVRNTEEGPRNDR
jgi:hypothetical protein